MGAENYVAPILKALFDNPKTARFAQSLRHADLPQGWANDKEIVALAEQAYKDMGTESPFFKAWFGKSKIVDEDGLPQKVYHASDSKFDTFDPTKSRANMDIQGSFFSPWEDDARGYGKNLYETYLSIQNPANSSKGYKALKAHTGENGAGVSAREDLKRAGFDGVNNDDEEFIAFLSNQIKSTKNRGTFNPDDPSILRAALPYLGVGAGAVAALNAGDAQASPTTFIPNYKPKEKGLEQPWLDPTSMAVAPVGAVGIGGKAASVAFDPAISAMMQAILGGN